MSAINDLEIYLKDIVNLDHTLSMLHWDMETYMPAGGAEARSQHIATLARIRHEMLLNETCMQLLEQAEDNVKDDDPDSIAAITVRVFRKDLDNAIKLPTDFVVQFAELTTQARHKWVEARAQNEFHLFEPYLEKIVAMCRQKTEYLGFEDQPYDALLQEYERSLTTRQVAEIFDQHKPALIDLVHAISDVEDHVQDTILHQAFAVESQKHFSKMVATQLGYDFNRGRLDVSVHPFSTSFSKNDARITTRFDANWLNPALFSTMHEVGHALYEQNIADELDGTILGDGTSLSVHESQSRTWENLVGRSRLFWEWAYPKLVDGFPDQLANVSLDEFYKAINRVQPSLIRVEADECTYNLHIMCRFEIEQQLIHGDISVKDVPDIWNSLYQKYLGVTPESDAQGCLQDIHWSMGGFGYFATYALGNLLGSQYFKQAKKDIPTLDQNIASGNFESLLDWQRQNIHRHGRKYDCDVLTQRICGETIQSDDYMEYLKYKFSQIYDING